MSILWIVFLLSVAEGENDCVGPIPVEMKFLDCSGTNFTTVPVLPEGALRV